MATISLRAPRQRFAVACVLALASLRLAAGEHLLGYVKGAEPLPRGASEAYWFVTARDDKDAGTYHAVDYLAEYEHGLTDRLTLSGAFKAMSLDTRGLAIDGYLPQDRRFSLRPSEVEIEGLYNFRSPAKDNFGLSGSLSFDYEWIDRHSGQPKDTLSTELALLAQKYFREGEIVWLANAAIESTYARRHAIAGLPEDFDWPTDPEMEVELKFGTGLSYRFVPRWFIGAEALYETEFETEIGQERWTWFAGPSLHYSGGRWWATLTYLGQLAGGGERYAGQSGSRLHLIEKTRQELRFKLALVF